MAVFTSGGQVIIDRIFGGRDDNRSIDVSEVVYRNLNIFGACIFRVGKQYPVAKTPSRTFYADNHLGGSVKPNARRDNLKGIGSPCDEHLGCFVWLIIELTNSLLYALQSLGGNVGASVDYPGYGLV